MGANTGGERISGESSRGDNTNGTKAHGERITCKSYLIYSKQQMLFTGPRTAGERMTGVKRIGDKMIGFWFRNV